VICNSSGGSATATINLKNSEGTEIPLLSVTVLGNTSQFIDLNQIVYDQETITGSASSSNIKFHIAGFEV
jgi:hypothetical protein